jgi:alpha-L-arabinofuranosidase
MQNHICFVRTRPRWLLLFALNLFVHLTTVAGLSAQTARPAAYLTFDEGTGTVAHDSPGSNHNAALIGGTGWTTGIVGTHALSVPGASGSYAEIPNIVLDTTKSYTVAAWVKLNNVDGYQTFVCEDGDSLGAFFLQLRGDTHQFSFTIPHNFFINPQSGITPVVGTWYHLAGVYDAAAQSATLYVNGALADTIYNVAPQAAKGRSGIGRGWFNNRPVDFASAAIDDVRFYTSALGAPEILQIARAGNASLVMPTVQPASLQIDANHPGAKINPLFYGLMIEEISHSLDGGLYAELIQNRVFKDNPTTPVHWSLVEDGGGAGSFALDDAQPVRDTALTNSLRVSVSRGSRVGVANDGYWGIPVMPHITYRASLWAKAAAGFSGPLTLGVESSDGKTIYASAQVPKITTDWAKYTVLLKTASVQPTEKGRFVISTGSSGTFWLNQVSLFRPTYHNRPNGNRIDLMEKLEALKPAFLRMPGGNYLEGKTLDQRFEWKKTIGPLEQRPGHEGTWDYRSDDGLGLLEFLEWCEDLRMQPVLAVHAGYALNVTHINPGPELVSYVQDALDEIQYVTGGPDTLWGARRAADGHPAPFPLQYVEIGNEDFFDITGSYDGRFTQFYDAIKAAYPNLKLIATTRVTSRTPDLIDDHFYDTPRAMARNSNHYDSYSRTAPKIFVGEWASQEGGPTPNLYAALGDAAWLAGLERNSDVVTLEAYAPLLVNVNPGAFQWPTNLIGYDALRSYGSPSYYMQVMFDKYHGDVVLPTILKTSGGSQLYESVTHDSRDKTTYLKLVNMAAAVQPLHVTLKGISGIKPTGRAVVLTSRSPQDTNTLTEPSRVVPTDIKVGGLGQSFDLQLSPYSIMILQIEVKPQSGHQGP